MPAFEPTARVRHVVVLATALVAFALGARANPDDPAADENFDDRWVTASSDHFVVDGSYRQVDNRGEYSGNRPAAACAARFAILPTPSGPARDAQVGLLRSPGARAVQRFLLARQHPRVRRRLPEAIQSSAVGNGEG